MLVHTVNIKSESISSIKSSSNHVKFLTKQRQVAGELLRFWIPKDLIVCQIPCSRHQTEQTHFVHYTTLTVLPIWKISLSSYKIFVVSPSTEVFSWDFRKISSFFRTGHKGKLCSLKQAFTKSLWQWKMNLAWKIKLSHHGYDIFTDV